MTTLVSTRDTRLALSAGAVLGFLSVMFGAFGAHALKGILDARALGWFELAVQYQSHHALALLLGGGLLHQGMNQPWLRRATIAWIAGVLLFCGSLYLMAFTGMTRLGMITPLGGVAFLGGWLCLLVAVIPKTSESTPSKSGRA